MAALTWREVSAPDLSTSLRGYEMFNRSLQDSLGGLRDTLAGADKEITDQASQGLILQALQAKDPEAVRAIMASADPKRINAQAIAMFGARPGQILQEQNAQQVLDQNRYSFAQEKAGDALAQTFVEASNLSRSGNVAGATALYDTNKAGFAAAGLKTSQAFAKALQDSEEFGVDLTGKRQDQKLALEANTRSWNADKRAANQDTRDQGRYGREVTEWQENREANDFVSSVIQSSDPSNRETIRNAVFNGGLNKLSGTAQAAAFGRLNSQFPGWFNPDEFGVSAGGGGGSGSPAPVGSVNDTSRVMNYEARASGFASVPDSVKTMGDASKFALEVNRANKARTGKPGSSAMGTFQIVGDTMRQYAPKVLGKDWESKEFTQGNQEKIAQAIFNDSKGSAESLRKQWVSLSPADAERVRKMPWEQARVEIAARESSTSANAFGGSTPAVMMGAAVRQGQDRAGRSSAQELIDASNGPTNPLDVVESLRTSDRFKGTSKEFLTTELNSIIERSKVKGRPTITAAQAGVLLRDGVRVSDSGDSIFSTIANTWNGNSAKINKAGDRIDRNYITQEIERAKSGNGLVNDAVREVDTAQSMAQLQAAQDQASRAAAALQSAERRAVTQPALAAQLPLLRASAAAAAKKLEQTRNQVEQRNRPIQQPVAQTRGGGGYLDAAANGMKSFWKDIAG